MTTIGWLRIANSVMTTIQASVGALALPEPWNILGPLLIGALVQGLVEALNVLAPKTSVPTPQVPGIDPPKP